MLNSWINGEITNKSRILKAVQNESIARDIEEAIDDEKVAKVLAKISTKGEISFERLYDEDENKNNKDSSWP